MPHRVTNFPACVVAALALVSCASPSRRSQEIAHHGGLQALSLPGIGFQHRAFAAVRGSDDLLVVFVEGDGSPWVDRGRRIAADPTPRVPLALKLAVATSDSVLYLGRPCYLDLRPQPGCAEKYWTSDRYSAAVVASMVAAAAAYLAEHPFKRVLLVGYSGGGALAALMARHLPQAVGVLTIAGNLDPDSWTRLHGYLPLTGSLNPSAEPPLPVTLSEWHLVGERDTNVPYAAAQQYLQHVPPGRIWRYASFDHVCCWEREWPVILARVHAELGGVVK